MLGVGNVVLFELIDLGKRGKNTDLGVCSKITITAVNRFPFLRLRVESCILIQYIYYHPYETIVIVSAASLGQRSRR